MSTLHMLMHYTTSPDPLNFLPLHGKKITNSFNVATALLRNFYFIMIISIKDMTECFANISIFICSSHLSVKTQLWNNMIGSWWKLLLPLANYIAYVHVITFNSWNKLFIDNASQALHALIEIQLEDLSFPSKIN